MLAALAHGALVAACTKVPETGACPQVVHHAATIAPSLHPANVTGAFAALVIAFVCDWKGLFTKSIGDRVAAACVIVAANVFLVGTGLQGLIHDGLQWTMNLVGSVFIDNDWSPGFGRELQRHGVGWLVVLVAALWIAALLHKGASKFVGEVAHEEFSSKMIWIGGPVIAMFIHEAPILGGPLSSLFGLIARITGGLIMKLVGA
jgi:hypothetical protein